MIRLLKVLKRKSGLTLVEALVSVIILGLASWSILGAFLMGKTSAIMAKHHMEAMNYARAAMERYISNGSTTYALPSGDISDLGGSCSISTSAHATGLTQVTVTISWNEASMGGTRPATSEQLVMLVRP
jgi:type II secretory pathway pseudopilin PulG